MAEGIPLLIKKIDIRSICSIDRIDPKINKIKNSLKPKPLYVIGMKPIRLIMLTNPIILRKEKLLISAKYKNILKCKNVKIISNKFKYIIFLKFINKIV